MALSNFHHALLMTGRAEISQLVEQCRKVSAAAILAFYAGKAIARIAEIQIPIKSSAEHRAESVLS